MTPEELAEEGKALGRIFHALLSYSRNARQEVARWERNYEKLSEAHKALMPNFKSKVEAALEGITLNQRFLTAMVQAFGDPSLGPAALMEVRRRLQTNTRPSASDADKVLYVLKNSVRDWAEEGQQERAQSYGRICDEIQKHVPVGDAHVLVPGCGLGRLPFELAQLGYHAEGNEFSFFMLVASAFILNHLNGKEAIDICPWMHSESNNRCDADQMRQVSIPDSIANAQQCAGTMSMSAGDFAAVYSNTTYQATFQAVVTCFFIDCGHNIFELIDIIYDILKVGGIWINLGPLLYHWADSHAYLPQEELSIEPSLEDIERAVQNKGFKHIQRQMVPTSFNANPRSLVKHGYESVFWTVQK